MQPLWVEKLQLGIIESANTSLREDNNFGGMQERANIH